MTRTDVMASSRPHTETATGRVSAGVSRRAGAMLALLLLTAALVLPGVAMAEVQSTYSTKPNVPTSKSGTAPSKETKEPTSSTTPATTSTTPTETKASTLPFTGFDLRWSLAIGVVLMGAGFSIVAVQRRQRRGSRR
jgi:hypothetical protein